MRKAKRFCTSASNRLSKHRNPLARQKRRNRQRRHVLYAIHISDC
ncbi:MAG: hypothetical protein UHG91_05270 [Succinivibrionaceae bacterium]|nr:hypothetical protein [Ruminobacter sp.]MDY5779449.1 hypothetical protein [Succinivibrionaceae bacterium]MEE1340175.1 hypothetical protein [Succinivibrionaceae bacterium]